MFKCNALNLWIGLTLLWGFAGWCRQVAGIIAGYFLPTLRPLIEIDPQTPALNLALNAVWNGALATLASSLSQQAQ
jgi:hypothetical protein